MDPKLKASPEMPLNVIKSLTGNVVVIALRFARVPVVPTGSDVPLS
jgi:hypothetical protein